MRKSPETRKNEKEDMTVQCAWCRKIMHQGTSEKISHGICLDCSKKMEQEIEK